MKKIIIYYYLNNGDKKSEQEGLNDNDIYILKKNFLLI